MVLIGAKPNPQSTPSICKLDKSNHFRSATAIPTFSIKSFVPVRLSSASIFDPTLTEDRGFTMATLKRPKVEYQY